MNAQLARFRLHNSLNSSVFKPEVVVCILVAALIGSAMADNAAARDFDQRVYGGIGLGVSDLDPQSTTPSLTVGDSTDQAFKLFLGFDLASRLSVEAFYADLGEAGIQFIGDDVGTIEYQVAGVSALGYLFGTRLHHSDSPDSALASREGLAAYLRLGLGIMENESNLNYDRDHKLHLHTGLGLEYGWSNGLAVRAEVAAYDSDAAFAGVSLLKRFGKRAPLPPAVAETPDQRSAVITDPVIPVVTPGLSSTYFAFGKYDLTPQTRSVLDMLAEQLKNQPQAVISIEGHTDDIDTEAYNLALSLKRASAVKAYLESKDIDATRMQLSWFGETRPVATNQTLDGRSLNRRVEIYWR